MLALEVVLPSQTGGRILLSVALVFIALLVTTASLTARRRREQREELQARVSALESGAGLESEPASQ